MEFDTPPEAMDMFNFNKEADYVRTVDNTKTLLREMVTYFDRLKKEIDTKKLEEMFSQIDNPFMLLVCGEYNSGKSTFINALLGDAICKIGSTPTTDKINIIKNGFSDVENIKSNIINIIDVDLELLKDFLIVDTPGTNSIIKEHQDITKKFIHRAELILFITSADRPFSESERLMLELISSKYGKKIVFVLNKVDQKEKEDVDEIIKFIEDNSVKLLDIRPTILPVSSKLAYEGLSKNDKEKIELSNINFVIKSVNEIYKRNALYLKLDSPLSTSLKLLDEVIEQIIKDNDKIEEEVKEYDSFTVKLTQFKDDLFKDYKKKTELIKGNFYEIENEMYKVIDSITFPKLLKSKLPFTKKKLEYNFEAQMKQLAEKVNNTLEGLTYDVAQDTKKMYGLAEDFTKKQVNKYKRDEMELQTASPDFIDTGRQILDTLRNLFTSNLKEVNLTEESKHIKKSIDEGFTASFVGSLASLGIGGGLIAILPTLMMDIVGISIAIVLAISSLFILPIKRKQSKKVLSEKFKELSEILTKVTLEKIKEDIIRIYNRIERDLKPYRSFLASEKNIISLNKETSEKLKEGAIDIKTLVEKKFKNRKSEF
jgi:small GTP-binding protein